MTRTELLLVAGAVAAGAVAWAYWRSTRPARPRLGPAGYPDHLTGAPMVDAFGGVVIAGVLPAGVCRCLNPDGSPCC
jgi:hypothetical protein